MSKQTLAEIIAAKKALLALERAAAQPTPANEVSVPDAIQSTLSSTLSSTLPTIILNKEEEEKQTSKTFALNITLNKEQLLAKELAFNGKSFVLTGAAGTGKTTAQREIARSLLSQGLLKTHNFRIQGSNGQRWDGPSVAFCAYTRIASGNLRRAIHKDPELEAIFEHNITTIHNLLEYAPETYWCYEEQKEKFRFVPKRTAQNPLDITHLIIEESSMLGLDLWQQLYDALRNDVQIIFLGDINQLQPVFGASILNYALTQLPVVELTHVYRQAGDSTILENAHNILNGRTLKEAPDFQILRGKDTNPSQEKQARALANMFNTLEDKGEYDVEQDIILSPFNVKPLGTDNLNKWIAQHMGQKRDAVVHEVIAGIAKHYLAVGDKVMYNKMVGQIITINYNAEYHGKAPLPPSKNLTRFGSYIATEGDNDDSDEFELSGYENLDLDKMLDEEQDDTKLRQASHVVTLEMEDGLQVTLSAVGDYSSQTFSLGYCLTVHKAQGCEWRKVFLILHKDHSIMAYRELLYTAVTRAAKEMVVIAKDFMIEKAIKTQRIKGNTLADKIEFFNAKVSLDAQVKCYK
jgi:exodeoxyribonuclease V alpha subunit